MAQRLHVQILAFTIYLIAACIPSSSHAQITLVWTENGSAELFNLKNESEVLSFAREKQRDAWNQGNFQYSIDVLDFRNDSAFAIVHSDQPEGLNAQVNMKATVTAATERRFSRWQQQPFNPNELLSIFDQIITEYENNGYPFARLNLDSRMEGHDSLYLEVNLQQGPLIKIDSLVLKSEDKLSRSYLSNYLLLKQGDPYKESEIRSLPTRIREITWVESSKDPEVLFTEDGAQIYMYLKARKANSFNGILGIQPNDQTGQVIITGDLDLKLENALRRGEKINLAWRRLQTETQELKLGLRYPFLFNTQIGVGGNVSLFRRDSTFSEAITGLSLLYLLKGSDFVKVFYESRNSNSLADATSLSLADTKVQAYGLGIDLTRLDFRLNPTRGITVDVSTSLGNKNIRTPDPDIPDITREREITQWAVNGSADLFVPLGKRQTFRIGLKGASIQAEEIFENEMHRIGGIKSIRGFDEASILASSFAVGIAEYRFLLDETSALYAFFDQGWYENRNPDNQVKDRPYGMGIGLNFQTKPGIFSLTYALGSQFHGPILFRNAKVHFGFVSLF